MKASISRIKCFKSCRRLYELKYLENLEPVQKAEALEIGTNYHELLENLYKTGELPTGDYSKEAAMAAAYKKYIYPNFKVAAVEEWNEAPIGSHILIGRVDGISADGKLVEHKTTSIEPVEYEFNLQWDEQILAYMYLTGTRSVYYTVCRKPTIRLKKNETEEEFYQRMVEWYDEDTESKIALLEISRTDEEVEAFAKAFGIICDEMQSATDNRDKLYRNTSHCNCWGRRCEYSSVCLHYDPEQEYVEFVKGGRSI